jgi:hypothetical protein
MSLKRQIDDDLKTAMLAGDKVLVTTLRGLKSAILYAELAAGKRDEGLPGPEIIDVLTKEAKKRQESADLYEQGGSQERANAELKEKAVIAKYLPEQLSEEDLQKLVDEAVAQIGNNPQKMGQIIGAVKQKAGAAADGATIAKLVKEKLT